MIQKTQKSYKIYIFNKQKKLKKISGSNTPNLLFCDDLMNNEKTGGYKFEVRSLNTIEFIINHVISDCNYNVLAI